MTKRLTWLVALTVSACLTAAGCGSTHEKGVKSNLRKQWTDVAANTETTTAAAKAVLESENLKNVEANATGVDGKATAQMADGTKVNVDIKKKTDNISQVSVVVGNFGDPELGAEIARKIQQQAEGK